MQTVRILHILHSMNRGGAENALMNYYRHIDRERVQFDFLLTDAKHTLFEDEILSLGGRVYRVPLLTIGNPFPYIKGVLSFFKKHTEYKIVHSHTSSKSVIPLALARGMGVPARCSHSHNSKSEGGLRGLIRNAMMPFLKLVATDWLSCGDKAAIWLYGQRAFEQGRVKVFKNVIEADKYRLNPDTRSVYREKMGVDDSTVLLGHTARFSEVKNHVFDVDILVSLKRSGCKVKLLLLGNGEQESSIKDKAVQAGVIDDIIFAGVVPNVYDYEQAMDVFLLPSHYEGLPLSIVEAQVSGLPCFTTQGVVSEECSITDLVHYLPLEAGADKWAKDIKEAIKGLRRDRYAEVAAAGYDASTSAKLLQDFYLQRYQETM